MTPWSRPTSARTNSQPHFRHKALGYARLWLSSFLFDVFRVWAFRLSCAHSPGLMGTLRASWFLGLSNDRLSCSFYHCYFLDTVDLRRETVA